MQNKTSTSFAVIGAGSTGQAMAAHLALMGYHVRLYNRHEDRIKNIISRDNSIKLEGRIKGTGRLETVTTDIRQAVRDADILFIDVPASAHRSIAKICAPHLEDGQTVILNPGRTGGAIEFSRVLNDSGSKADVTIAETQTVIYTTRSTADAEIEIFAIKNRVPLAAFPASKTQTVIETMKNIYPQFVPASNVLETGLNNVGAILHPVPTLLSTSWIESPKTRFKYYYEAITPTISGFLEVIDRERIEVARAFGVKVISVKDWLFQAYGVKGNSLYEAIQNNTAYSQIDAPETLQHRYILEDVPTGLVPIASLGALAGVPVPNIMTIISLASKLLGIDFWATGRTVENLGLKGMSVDEVKRIAEGKE